MVASTGTSRKSRSVIERGNDPGLGCLGLGRVDIVLATAADSRAAPVDHHPQVTAVFRILGLRRHQHRLAVGPGGRVDASVHGRPLRIVDVVVVIVLRLVAGAGVGCPRLEDGDASTELGVQLVGQVLEASVVEQPGLPHGQELGQGWPIRIVSHVCSILP